MQGVARNQRVGVVVDDLARLKAFAASFLYIPPTFFTTDSKLLPPADMSDAADFCTVVFRQRHYVSEC